MGDVDNKPLFSSGDIAKAGGEQIFIFGSKVKSLCVIVDNEENNEMMIASESTGYNGYASYGLPIATGRLLNDSLVVIIEQIKKTIEVRSPKEATKKSKFRYYYRILAADGKKYWIPEVFLSPITNQEP